MLTLFLLFLVFALSAWEARARAATSRRPLAELVPMVLPRLQLVLGRLRLPELGSLALVLAWASFLLAPGTALADGQTSAAGSAISSAVLQFLVEHLTAALFASALVAALPFIGGYLSDRRKKQVATAAFHAFHIVEDIRAECDKNSKAFEYASKVEAGLAQVDKYMVANGWRPLRPGEEALAKLQFSSLNAQDNARKELAAAAASVVLPSSAPASTSPAPTADGSPSPQ